MRGRDKTETSPGRDRQLREAEKQRHRADNTSPTPQRAGGREQLLSYYSAAALIYRHLLILIKPIKLFLVRVQENLWTAGWQFASVYQEGKAEIRDIGLFDFTFLPIRLFNEDVKGAEPTGRDVTWSRGPIYNFIASNKEMHVSSGTSNRDSAWW